jgi:histone-lysine N-methyltransferase SETMAR
MSDNLREKKFDKDNDPKMDLANFFAQKSQDFYECGILSLPERWQQVIDSNGPYIVES